MGKLTLSASLLFMNENEVKAGGGEGEEGEGEEGEVEQVGYYGLRKK